MNNMVLKNIKKHLLGWIVVFLFTTYPLHAIDLSTGPCLGYQTSNSQVTIYNTHRQQCVHHALEVGWFVQLDLWLIYAKVAPACLFDWSQFSNKNELYKHWKIPFIMGIPILSVFRPHVSYTVQIIPHSETADTSSIEIPKSIFYGHSGKNSTMMHLFGGGLGIDLADFSIDVEVAYLLGHIDEHQFNANLDQVKSLVLHWKIDNPTRWIIRVGYNLLGLFR